MKRTIDDSFEMQMTKAYPCLKLAEEVIEEITGFTLEDIRSACRQQCYAEARIYFYHLCSEYIRPTYLLTSYMNSSHSMMNYWSKRYDDLFAYDKKFKRIATSIEETFNKKALEYGVF